MIGNPTHPTVPHPQPSFYETTEAVVWESGEGNVITHAEVEEILARPKWDYAKANREAMAKINVARISDRRKQKTTKKTAAKKTTPKKRT